MLQVDLSIKLSKKITAAKLKSAVIKLIAVVATCVCFINPGLRPNVDGLKSWTRGAIVRPASVFPDNILRLLVIAQRNELRVPRVVHIRPFDKLKMPDKLRLQPQCRMPDYTASAVTSVVICAFSVILFGIIRLSVRQRNRAPFCSRE
jgi:hypothetical protein